MNQSEPHRRLRSTAVQLLLCGLLAALVAAVFGATVRFEFLNYDDGPYVYENPHVAGGLTAEGVRWAFTERHASNWHPLTWLSHMFDCKLFGLHPWGHHLTSVVLHAAAACCLLLALQQMTGQLGPSLFAAALFAVHPLRVESVAWVAERKDVLCGLLFMLTLLAYTAYAQRPTSAIRYLATLLLYALGLMAKPMLVSLPAVLLLLDYWPLRRWPTASWRRLIWEKAPFAALAVGSSIMTLWAQRTALATGEIIPFAWRLANAATAYAGYMWQFVWSPGQPFYPHPGIHLPLANLIGATLLLAAVTVLCVAARRKAPYLLVGWGWFLVTLAPVIGVVQVGAQAAAERYTYLPHIGLAILVGWGGADLARRFRRGPQMAAVLVAAIVVFLGVRAFQHTAPWRNSVAFWQHVIETDCDGRLPDARHSLGVALEKRGQIDEAIAAYRTALAMAPSYAQPHINLANLLATGGRLAEAIEHYRQAVQSDPRSVLAHCNLATTLDQCGRTDEAYAEFQTALTLDPQSVEARNNLANVLAGHNQIDAAVEQFERALALRPQAAEIHFNYAQALAKAGRLDAAVAQLREAVALRPDQPTFCHNLAVGLYQQGRTAEAISQWQAVLRLQPRSVETLDALAAAYAECGRFADAVTTAEEALALVQAQGDRQRAEAITQRLAAYRQGRPARDDR